MTANTTETEVLLHRRSQGDAQAWGELIGMPGGLGAT